MDKIEQVKISKVKNNPNNPRLIKDDKFKKLVNSIKEFPEMLKIRPIVVNEDMIVLGGNMRLKACRDAGLKEVFIIKASELTEEQQREFIIKDNSGFGEWDEKELLENWDIEKLNDWGLDIEKKDEETIEVGEEEFSEYLDEAQNYVVLTFDNEVDWLSAQTHFELESVYSKRANGKAWSKGIGRVLNGAEYFKKLAK
jgi:ParB-like chromosome segregation protein Spo0J